MDINALNLPDDVKNAFRYFFDTFSYVFSVEEHEDRIILPVYESRCFRQKLILHISEKSYDSELLDLYFNGAQLVQTESGFKLVFSKDCGDEMILLAVDFDSASTESEVFRADRLIFSDYPDGSPWDALLRMADDIYGKSYWGSGYLNEKELELMPLLCELRAMAGISADDDGYAYDFPVLKSYMCAYGLGSMIPLLDKVRNAHTDAKGSMRAFTQLLNKLNAARCEALWRRLYGLISASQEGYSDPPPRCGDAELQKMREEITAHLHELGYEGDYPVFRKKGPLKGIRLERSYGLSHFVGLEKNAEYIIQCREDNRDIFQIEFLCATALLRKGETVTDAYSCCFNANGRRLFKTEFFTKSDGATPLSLCVEVAAKKAECIKLSKAEKELIYGKQPFNLPLFLLIFFVFGGFFAVGMTLCAIIICCIVTAVLLGFGEIPEMMAQMPWLLIFLISFVGAGFSMALAEIKSMEKY